ncbi:hypothetical protein B0H13DRAFT_2664710 [Mycena leptocephala]|nr:hypothetical protein B0H13DRAFT_2664710 [Mycena leptocephala]
MLHVVAAPLLSALKFLHSSPAVPLLFAFVSPSSRVALKPDAAALGPYECASAYVSSSPPVPFPPTLFHLATAHAYDMHVSARAGRRFRRFRSPPILSPQRLSTRELALVELVLGCGSEHTTKTSGNGIHGRGGADAALTRAGKDGVHDCAQHPASLTSRSNDDVGSFMGFNANPKEDEVHPDKSVSVVDCLTPDKLARHGFLGSRTPAYLVPSPVQRSTPRRFKRKSSGGMRMCSARGSESRSGFDSQIRSRGRRRSVYTHSLHSLKALHDILEAFMKPHQYLDDVADAYGDPDVAVAANISARARARARQGITEGRWRTFPDWIFMYEYPHGLPSTSLPALDPLQAVSESQLRLDVPTCPSRLVWCDTDTIPPLVTRPHASPLGPRSLHD